MRRKLDQSCVRVRHRPAHAGPPDLEQIPIGRCGRCLTVDHQHLELRQRQAGIEASHQATPSTECRASRPGGYHIRRIFASIKPS
jgi:hypothetical protein